MPEVCFLFWIRAEVLQCFQWSSLAESPWQIAWTKFHMWFSSRGVAMCFEMMWDNWCYFLLYIFLPRDRGTDHSSEGNLLHIIGLWLITSCMTSAHRTRGVHHKSSQASLEFLRWTMICVSMWSYHHSFFWIKTCKDLLQVSRYERVYTDMHELYLSDPVSPCILTWQVTFSPTMKWYGEKCRSLGQNFPIRENILLSAGRYSMSQKSNIAASLQPSLGEPTYEKFKRQLTTESEHQLPNLSNQFFQV